MQKFDWSSRHAYNIHRIENVKKDANSTRSFDIKSDIKNNWRLRDTLKIGKSVLVLPERLKKLIPKRLYKNKAKNGPFFDKNKIFIIRNVIKTNENTSTYFT